MGYRFISLSRSTGDKKYEVKLLNTETNRQKTIKFGAVGYDDYTITKDQAKKKSYIARHSVRENWSISGVDTPGFWARWLLWNKPTITASLADIKKRFF